MASSVVVHTPAKLNLFLEVIAKRTDGFHEIETLMTAVTLYDTLFISAVPQNEVRLTWRWARGIESSQTVDETAMGALPSESRCNIVWRAAELLRQRAGIDRGASIQLVKRIPTESGLGGASSDAAATLVGLNRLWQLNWAPARLSEIGAELGSDVPFFLSGPDNGATLGRCTGRGELVETIGALPRLHFVIVRPRQGLSTAAVYRTCRPAPQTQNSSALCDSLRSGDRRGLMRGLLNRLQEPAESLCPAIVHLRCEFQRLGCPAHQMSGSGSSYFAICQSARHSARVANLIRSTGLGYVFRAESAPRSPATISA